MQVLALTRFGIRPVYIVASVALFAWGLSSFPSLEKAVAKNGSISTYAFCAANLGMYVPC